MGDVRAARAGDGQCLPYHDRVSALVFDHQACALGCSVGDPTEVCVTSLFILALFRLAPASVCSAEQVDLTTTPTLRAPSHRPRANMNAGAARDVHRRTGQNPRAEQAAPRVTAAPPRRRIRVQKPICTGSQRERARQLRKPSRLREPHRHRIHAERPNNADQRRQPADVAEPAALPQVAAPRLPPPAATQPKSAAPQRRRQGPHRPRTRLPPRVRSEPRVRERRPAASEPIGNRKDRDPRKQDEEDRKPRR